MSYSSKTSLFSFDVNAFAKKSWKRTRPGFDPVICHWLQPINFEHKPFDWFPYDCNIGRKRGKFVYRFIMIVLKTFTFFQINVEFEVLKIHIRNLQNGLSLGMEHQYATDHLSSFADNHFPGYV